jgi:AraC-like DNA-binding protein
MLAVIQEPGAASTLFVDAVALAFVAHVARAYAGFFESKGSSGAGLAPWQLRRACAFIDAHLQGDLSLSDLARECRVSAGHFGRAFRQAVGVPPHQWLTMRRIERAKRLLMEGDLHLAQIALHCGFVDQSHLTRAFKRCEGCSPGKWRRLRGG